MRIIDFEEIIERKERRKELHEKFKKKKDYYFNWYTEKFLKFGYDKRSPDLFKVFVEFCSYYFCGINSKGLFLCAPVDESKKTIINTGIGKTMGMQAVSRLFGIRIETVFELAETKVLNIGRYENMLKEPNYYESKKVNDLIIDEVGAEEITNNYGKKSEIFTEVLEMRYREFVEKGSFTHFTSNLSAIDIEKRYGHRVWSRINEMCTVFEVSGKDQRFN